MTGSTEQQLLSRNEGTIDQGVDVTIPLNSRDLDLVDKVRTLGEEAANPDSTLAAMGFAFEASDQELKISAPTTDTLNSKLDSIGYDDRRYVDFDGEVVPPKGYLDYIGSGGLPRSTEPYFMLHDTADHRGFMFLPKRAWAQLRTTAKEAAETADEKTIDEAIGIIDLSTVGEVTKQKLTQLYALRMNKVTAAILAKKDMREVRHAYQTLGSKAATTPKPVSMSTQTQHYIEDEDLPIK